MKKGKFIFIWVIASLLVLVQICSFLIFAYRAYMVVMFTTADIRHCYADYTHYSKQFNTLRDYLISEYDSGLHDEYIEEDGELYCDFIEKGNGEVAIKLSKPRPVLEFEFLDCPDEVSAALSDIYFNAFDAIDGCPPLICFVTPDAFYFFLPEGETSYILAYSRRPFGAFSISPLKDKDKPCRFVRPAGMGWYHIWY